MKWAEGDEEMRKCCYREEERSETGLRLSWTFFSGNCRAVKWRTNVFFQSEGVTKREATFINKSLSFLEQAVINLSDKKVNTVHFRSSKLTHALKDSIGGRCNTVMIANIWPEMQHLEETVNFRSFRKMSKTFSFSKRKTFRFRRCDSPVEWCAFQLNQRSTK